MLRVLVVEGQATVSRRVAAMVRRHGRHAVHVTEDPATAAKLAARYHPDLVFVDTELGKTVLAPVKNLRRKSPQSTFVAICHKRDPCLQVYEAQVARIMGAKVFLQTVAVSKIPRILDVLFGPKSSLKRRRAASPLSVVQWLGDSTDRSEPGRSERGRAAHRRELSK